MPEKFFVISTLISDCDHCPNEVDVDEFETEEGARAAIQTETERATVNGHKMEYMLIQGVELPLDASSSVELSKE